MPKPNASARDKIRTQMERMRPEFTLMYCADDPKAAPASFKYEQRVFRLPPMQHVVISDVVGVPKEKAYDYSLGPSQPRPWHTASTGRGPKERVTIAPADKVVSHGISQLWQRGVVLLTDDAAADAQEIEQGRQRNRVWQQKQDEVVVGAFHKRMEDFTSDPRNKHLPRPLMGKLERDAQTRLDRYRREDYGSNVSAEDRCSFADCSYWSSDPKEMEQHTLAAHGAEASTMTGDTAAIEKAAEEREAQRQEKRRADLAEKRKQLQAEALKAAAQVPLPEEGVAS